MHPMYDLLLHLRSANLGHEAVIEILLGLLGLMIAVLTLISGLLAIGIAVVGWFGYTAIRDEAGKRAEQAASQTAKDVAKDVATEIAKDYVRRIVRQEEASAMTTAQAVDESKPGIETKASRQKATTDSSLRKEDL
jgi:hypothetical protein